MGEATTSIAEKIGNPLKQIIDYEIMLFDFHNLEECIEKTTALLEKLSKNMMKSMSIFLQEPLS